jgi:HD-GYP domain-containing protein (c-di-GMP phosphodiesterase class II)
MKKLGERLIESGLITTEALEKALQRQRITGHKLGDCLVEIGLVQETAMLRLLAAELNTRFVSSEKLAQVKIPTHVLDKVPVRLAERQRVLPIAWDPERKALSVVMAEPQDDSLVKELAALAGAEEVHAFIALTAPIQAGIRKHYYGDPNAFSMLAHGARRPPAEAASGGSHGSGVTHAPATNSAQRPTRPPVHHAMQFGDTFGAARGRFSDHDYAETLKTLVGLLEAEREELRGHSALLARHACALARRLGLAPREVARVNIAASLHHVGKPPDRHFTLYDNDAQPLWKSEARRWVHAPLRLFHAVHLPAQVKQILLQLYEAWDGSGVPQGARGEGIAPGARVLAAVDAFLELRRTHSKAEALAQLRADAGRLFDPQVVAELERVQTGEALRQRLECDGRMILVAEPDPGVRSALVDALVRAGLAAYGVGSLDGVAEAMATGEADVLVVGLRFGASDVLALLHRIRTQPESAGTPVALLGDPPDPAAREQLLFNRLEAILPLPLDADAAARTVVELHVDRIAHGGPARVVIGGFDELPAREVLAVLARHRKSGRLRVQAGGREASLQMESGRVVHVAADERVPEEALREIASAAAGEFSFDANAVLMDPPNVDVDLSAVLQRISPLEA